MKNYTKMSVYISYTLLLLITVTSAVHAAINLTVVNENNTPVNGFKWTLEENMKFDVIPGVPVQDSLSLSFHNSYSPLVATGECTGTGSSSCTIDTDPGKKYFITVLPFVEHSMGGKTFLGSDSDVNVAVHTHSIPTAQVTVRIFHDNHPINGAPDDPEELGLPLATGQFTVHIADAGGRYGQTGGDIIQDAFGNPLGTEYDPNNPGVVTQLGDGILTPDAEGFVYIKNMPPAKYGITVIPPAGEGWIQTSTIEGSKTVDAWVLANEPEFFVEFGPPGPHVFIGFVKQFNMIPAGNGSVTGRITNNHMARPPEVGFFSGNAFGGCWVGLNETVAAGGQALFAAPCNEDSTFAISGIPEGTYEIVVWDENLNIVIAKRTIDVGANTVLALGDVPVFGWFARMEARVFLDLNENGFRDNGEVAIPEQGTGLRFRNGTPYQAFATDLGGEAPYDEIFPFFHWLVAEVDFARYKATGVTYVVDGGGEILPDNGWDMPSFDILNPQLQDSVNPNTGNNLSTTLTGPVISLATQMFLGQTNVIEWGKVSYGTQDVDDAPYGNFPGIEDVDYDGDGQFDYGNGGISGMAIYAITRAEDDPRFAGAEEWEPGIPRIQMNLYRDTDNDETIDDLVDGVPGITLADSDNAPQGNFPGSEDVDRNGNGIFDYGDAIQVTYTDSWDDSLPTGCAGETFVAHPGTAIEKTTDCFDGLRNFNQLREGVYDGGYAFTSRIARDENGAPTGAEIPGLVAGFYIVESTVPVGYTLLKEEDKNVDFGDGFVPALLPPVCVGDDHLIPEFVSFQTGSTGDPLPGIAAADLINSPFYDPAAVTVRPLCDRKHIALTAGKNAAADFFMFTQAPIAAHLVGGILNDLGNEFDPNNPNFGEKFAPSWVPVAFYDWAGKEVIKVYADEFGKFEALVPSTATVNIASATGMAPNMLFACMNDPSPIANPNYDPTDASSSPFINDPNYNPQFSTFCYTFQYMPGSTTYLDTPVVPVAAFASVGNSPVDCAIPDNKPLIKYVTGPGGSTGPVIATDSTARELTIFSEGMVDVPNHLFGMAGEPITIPRNYGFGATQGTVFIGNDELTVTSWSDVVVQVTVPANVATGQLLLTTSTGVKSPRGVTVTTHLPAAGIHSVSPALLPATPIQDAIDAADPGELILLSPGTYSELVIMDKPVQLQGWGAGVTRISAIRTPPSKLEDWRQQIIARDGITYDYLPNQEKQFLAEEGPGIIVLGQSTGNFIEAHQPRIDGIEITGASTGGGIFVNAYVDYLTISNNKIKGNEGIYGGGIHVGNPTLITVLNNGAVPTDSDNDFINIHDNEIVLNGTTFGSGGGIALYTGSDDYTINHNFICGNFAQDNGAGIAHLGLSDNGVISNNTIAFNQNFNQGKNVHGAGLFIGGQPGLALQETEGSGDVVVEANLIQGNSAGAGFGAGITLSEINGVDVANNTSDSAQWFGIDIFDNMIVNNHAGWTGAGIAMQDAAKVRIINNTIAHNDATATVGNVFDSDANTSTAQPGAGIVSFAHSGVLAANSAQTFSNPKLRNNIIWQNRTFSWQIDVTTIPATYGLMPDVVNGGVAVFSDLAVIGTTGALDPRHSILTDASGTHTSNSSSNPEFILDYFNGDRSQTVIQGEQSIVTQIGSAAALDEGGNFVDIHFGPLSISGNYHLKTSSPAINGGVDSMIAELVDDIDGEARTTPFDIGADEVVVAITPDTDGDGVVDTQDNCILIINPDQRDSNADGFGNICDADLDNNGQVGFSDFSLFRVSFGSNDADADFDGSGQVGFSDFSLFRVMFGKPPGPSGIAN